MKVGDFVWYCDGNQRVYRADKSGPIWRRHWRKVEITGETSRSWVAGYRWNATKLPKKGGWPRGWVATEAEIDRLEWVRENAIRIGHKVERLDSYELLKQIEELLS